MKFQLHDRIIKTKRTGGRYPSVPKEVIEVAPHPGNPRCMAYRLENLEGVGKGTKRWVVCTVIDAEFEKC